jgi:hypothetical protein
VLPVILLRDLFNREKLFCQDFFDGTNPVIFQTRSLFSHKLKEKFYEQQPPPQIFKEILYHYMFVLFISPFKNFRIIEAILRQR